VTVQQDLSISNDPAIQALNLSKSYRSDNGNVATIALNSINLKIVAGESVAIIGPNASGKSTLIRCLVGIQDFDEGQVRLRAVPRGSVTLDARYTKRPDSTIWRKIGYVSQDVALWPHMTVIENVAAPLHDLHSYNRREANDHAHLWLDRFGLDSETLGRYPAELSGGQRRRVALARACAPGPDFLFLDEVTADLDAGALDRVLRALQDTFFDNPQKTVVSVTHRLDVLKRCSSRVIVVDKGRIASTNTPGEILGEDHKHESGASNFPFTIVDPGNDQSLCRLYAMQAMMEISRTQREVIESGGEIEAWRMATIECSKILSRFITKVDGPDDHLVMVVAPGHKAVDPLIRGITVTKGFCIDGRDSSLIAGLPSREEVHVDTGKKQTKAVVLTEDAPAFAEAIVKEHAHLARATHRSLVRTLLTNEEHLDLKYRYAPGSEVVHDVYHSIVPVPEDRDLDRSAYAELSTETRNVYLFPSRRRDGGILGVISVDTYSRDQWRPWVVSCIQDILEVASLCFVKSSGALALGSSLGG